MSSLDLVVVTCTRRIQLHLIAYNPPMEWLAWFFLESLIALGATLFVALFILLVYWRRTGQSRPLLIGSAIGLVLLSVQALVVTRREHADRILSQIAKETLIPQTTALARSLSSTFQIENMDRDEFLDFVRPRLADAHVAQIYQADLRVTESRDNDFVATVVYLSDVSVRDFRGYFKSKWNIRLVREVGDWKIAEIVPVEFNNQPIGSFGNIPH